MIFIHGKEQCPYAWRARIAAHAKGLAFAWLPYDVDEPDPRALAGNPTRRSPLLRDGDFTLAESAAVAQYLDEAYWGPPLQSRNPKERARARVDEALLVPRFEHAAEEDPADETVEELDAVWAALDERIAADEWLGGRYFGIADVLIAPFVAKLIAREDAPSPERRRARDYAERLLGHPAVRDTRPRPVAVRATHA